MVGKEGTLRRRLRLIMLDFVLESVLLVVLVLDLGNRGHIGGFDMATTVKITETFDMKTTVGKMGLVAVHTPALTLLSKLYPGLMKNHKFVRFVKCDVVGACASVLPADPLQVGVSAGEVAPEDMFNPILYKAVTNEGFDTLVNRMYALGGVGPLGSVDNGDLADATVNPDSNFKVYYALLAENGKWRKAMPQAGFKISGLVPLAHTVLSQYGNNGSVGNLSALADDGETSVPIPDMEVPTVPVNWPAEAGSTNEMFFRGKSVKMPRFPLHTGREALADVPVPNIPKTMVCALCLPPAKLHEFYYRMRVTWTVRFEQVISTNEIDGFIDMLSNGNYSHYTNYSFSKSAGDMSDNDMISADSVDINKIMES